jgi:TolB-like protein/tetratricopeptide (TPR) repeat protein
MSAEPSRAVFLSYASQDAEAARRIAETLRSAGVEVWFDQSELVGGELWDTKIRRQIASCALFLPVISANTQARLEGYFRLEWKIAAQRTHAMAEERSFLLPVVIDSTRDTDARVPVEFRAVQWTKLPAGEAAAGFIKRVQSLLRAPSTSTAAPAPAKMVPSAFTPVAKPGRAVWVVAAVGALVLAFIAFTLMRPSAKETPTAAAPESKAETKPTPAIPTQSLAVLAFANMSGDHEMEYFADGISEEILNALDRNPALRVTPRTSSFSFKGKNVAVDEIGRVLRVASVIEGSVRKAGNKVRITVKLINAADGTRVWAEDFNREMNDIFTLQDEIAARVAQKLGGSAGRTPTNALPVGAQTKNLHAYDAFLRGRAKQISGLRGPHAKDVVRLYEDAVRLDPAYALAWARLAQTIVARVGAGGYDSSAGTKAAARNAAVTALKLAPSLPEAHISMAEVRLFVDSNLEEAEREIAQAEQLRPNDSETPALRVRLERARGRWGESLVTLIARAEELDPLNAYSLTDLGLVLTDIGRFADAERLLQRSWILSQASSGTLRGLASIAVAWTGDVQGALDILDRIPEELRTTPLYHENRANIRTLSGDFAGAIADLEQLRLLARQPMFQTSGPRTRFVNAPYRLAQLMIKTGQSERAAQFHNEALASSQQLAKDHPGLHPSYWTLALALATRGDNTGSLKAIEDMESLATRTQDAVEIANMRQAKAEVLTVLGDTPGAIAELRAVHAMGRAFGHELRLDPAWEQLREDPGFQQLMKEAEAQADAQPRPARAQLR